MGNESSNLITQIDFARARQITPAMRVVAEKEGRSAEFIREGVAAGRIAIPANIHHTSLSPEGVGEGLRTKVNVNLGISGDLADESVEWQKVDTAIELGAEAIMDLSNSGKTQAFRTKLIEKSPAMIGTVPMYDAIGYLEKALIAIKAEDFLDVVRRHAEDGVDFVTIHAGMNRRTIEFFKETGRLMNIVSRGGSLIFAWMEATGNENPFYEHYDEVLEILHEHDVTISIGDAMRPGCTYDAVSYTHLRKRLMSSTKSLPITTSTSARTSTIAASRWEARSSSASPSFSGRAAFAHRVTSACSMRCVSSLRP